MSKYCLLDYAYYKDTLSKGFSREKDWKELKAQNWTDFQKKIAKGDWDFLFKHTKDVFYPAVGGVKTDIHKLKTLNTENLKVFNHFSNSYCIDDKIELYKTLSDFMGDGVDEIVPKTYINSIKIDSQKIYIYKPSASFGGKGIELLRGNEIDNKISKKGVYQEYITNPLLYQGRKFDIRLMFLSLETGDGFDIYVYPEGYVRTSSEKFTLKNLDNLAIHLTNNSFQKDSPNYAKYEPMNLVSFSHFFEYFNSLGFNSQNLMTDMCKIGLTVFNASKHMINQDKNPYLRTFEFFGMDFMVLDDGTVKLIECNSGPALFFNDSGNRIIGSDKTSEGAWINKLAYKISSDLVNLTLHKFFKTKLSNVNKWIYLDTLKMKKYLLEYKYYNTILKTPFESKKDEWFEIPPKGKLTWVQFQKEIAKGDWDYLFKHDDEVYYPIPGNDKVNIHSLKFYYKANKRIISSFPNIWAIDDKDQLYVTLKDYAFRNRINLDSFLPPTFLGPEGLKKDRVYLFKPNTAFAGKGIQILLGKDAYRVHNPDKGIFQEYITDPVLYNGRKFDFRLMFLAVEKPGRKIALYVYPQGFIRTSSKKFKLDELSLKDLAIHLTNTTYQKYEPDFGKYEPGNTISFTDMFQYLSTKGFNITDLFVQMCQLSVLVFKAGKRKIMEGSNRALTSYQLCGIDLMLSKSKGLQLIEVNGAPGLTWNVKWADDLSKKILEEMVELTIDSNAKTGWIYLETI